jgi:gliding motility-associated-like protein
LPDPLTLGSDTVICPGNFITLKATRGYISYQWNTGSTGDSLTIAAPGKYWVMARDACGEVATDTLVVKAYKTGFFSAGENDRICPGESLTLQATQGYFNYKWSPDSSMQNGLTATPTVRPAKTTTYFVTAEERPGCFVADTVMVMVEAVYPFSLGPDFNICKGESRLITGPDGFATYSWNTGANTRDLNVAKTGSYILEAVSTEGCPQRDTVVLQSLYDLPLVKLDKDSVLCAGETKTYSSGGNYASYLWSNGSSGTTLTVNQPGLYGLQVVDNNGCRGSDSAEITRVEPLPTDFLPGDSTICNFDSWQLIPLKIFTSYLWNTGATTPGITIKDEGIYRLVVTNADGCKGTDDVNVSVKRCTEGLFVPTAFTPNSDGTNDTFKGMLFGNIISFDFRIFNRFGEVVFLSNDTQKGWNGFHKNKPQPAGTFIWNCRYQLQGQPIKVQKGSFMLIR